MNFHTFLFLWPVSVWNDEDQPTSRQYEGKMTLKLTNNDKYKKTVKVCDFDVLS